MKRTKRPAPDETNQIVDASSDRKYFIMTPRIVWAFSRNPFDLALWMVIKDVAGEKGQCTLETSNLATLAMMSSGQVQDSREYLIAVGLIIGKLYRDEHYPNPIWHLTVPDVWRPNVEWSQQFSQIKARLIFKSQQKDAVKKVWGRYKAIKAQRKAAGQWDYDREHASLDLPDFSEMGIVYAIQKPDSPGESVVKHSKPDSPGESGSTWSESGSTPGESGSTWSETKKNHKKNQLKEYGWMEGDLICDFLRSLPGYNPANLKTDRDAIAPHVQSYNLEALKYLWSDCEAGDNPIGLFLYRAGQGAQSPRYVELCSHRTDLDVKAGLSDPIWDKALGYLRKAFNGTYVAIHPALVAIDENPHKFTVLVGQNQPGLKTTVETAVASAVKDLKLRRTIHISIVTDWPGFTPMRRIAEVKPTPAALGGTHATAHPASNDTPATAAQRAAAERINAHRAAKQAAHQ